MDLQTFFEMGGYARFVWPAYGIAALVLGLNVWFARRRFADARQRAMRRLAMNGTTEEGST
jgi:heme exporter protein CcmD